MDGRGIGKSKNQDSVDRLSQALSSYADHRCNAVSKVYTQQPSQKPSVTRHNRTLSPAERGRVGSGCGMGQQCARASGEPSWACASRAVYVCRPASATRATAQI